MLVELAVFVIFCLVLWRSWGKASGSRTRVRVVVSRRSSDPTKETDTYVALPAQGGMGWLGWSEENTRILGVQTTIIPKTCVDILRLGASISRDSPCLGFRTGNELVFRWQTYAEVMSEGTSPHTHSRDVHR
jgi:hypothetical protein